MAYLDVKYFSGALGQMSAFGAIIPDGLTDDIPTMYLLHGLSDDYTAWQRYTAIEKYAEAHGMAVIMPGGARSFYEDMVYGRNYYTHVAKEVVEESRKLFRLSHKREKTFIAGLSMGGYGAFKIAMRNPDVFSAAGSLSGVVDMPGATAQKLWDNDAKLIFGDDFANCISGSDADLFALADKIAADKKDLRLIQIEGDEDFLLDGNRRFSEYAEKLGLDLTYAEHPGNHSWDFWDRYIVDVMDFFCGR